MAVTNPSLCGTLRRAAVRWVLLLVALGFARCNDSALVILNINTSGLTEGNAASILLRSQLNGVPGTEQHLERLQHRVAIELPGGASGNLQIDVFGLNEGGCKISSASLTVDVPSGLSRSVELPVMLNPMTPPQCTLTVTVSAGSLGWSVVSSPAGIDCSASATCMADFKQGTAVQLMPNPASARAYAAFSGACQGPATSCVVTLSNSQQVSASFLPIDCTVDGWCTQNQPTQTNTLRAVRVLDSQRAFSVGDGGVVLECNGAICTKYASNTTVNLRGVFPVDPNNIYAVGDSGTVLRCDTGSRSCMPLTSGAANAPLFSVWASDGTNVYAVGAAGTIVRCSTGSNTCTQIKLSPLPDTTFKAVWGTGTNAYAVGTGGIVYRCAAMGTCTPIGTGTTKDLNAVFGIDGTTVYVAGPSDALLECKNTMSTCNLKNPGGTLTTYVGVWSTDSSNVYSVGTGGRVVRCDFASGCVPAQYKPPPVTQTLNAIWGSDTRNIYVVGVGGTMQNCVTTGLMTDCAGRNSGTMQELRAISGFDKTHIWAVGVGGVVVYYTM